MKASRNLCVEIALRWKSAVAEHCDRRHFEKLNLWRDYFPGDLAERLTSAAVGDMVALDIPAGELVPAHDRALVQTLNRQQFIESPRPGLVVKPRLGRFYPGTFFDTQLFFKGDTRAGRVLTLDDQQLQVDFNHPFAHYPARLEATLVADLGEAAERGGRCNDIGQELTARGPGMQAPLSGGDTDFWSGDAFARLDARDDAQFYAEPRRVQHLDAAARQRITALYGRFLKPGMHVLDLMASWVSHLPEASELAVTGLGMNAAELAENPRFDARVVHDLNRNDRLPFADASFETVICTASVEYLTRPVEVFAEIARILKPGGVFVVTFSERWFPTKAIELWGELHPFERVALVLAYFQRAGAFVGLQTESLRGLPRPEDDTYARQMALSDPVYAVWAFSKR